MRTRRPRPHDRGAERQAVDADVQKAADDGAERGSDDDGRNTGHADGRGASGPRLFRRWPERRRSRQSHRAVGVDLVRPAGGIQRHAGKDTGADQRRPVGRTLSRPCRGDLNRLLQSIDLVERPQLRQTPVGLLFQPVVLGRLTNGRPHLARGSPIAPLRQRRRRQRLQPPRRAGHLAALFERGCRGAVVVREPVMHEADVQQVFPFVGPLAQTLLEQRDRQIRPAGTAWIRLGEEDRAEPVGDVEQRIQRGGEIEQRIQQRIAGGGIRGQRRRRRQLRRRGCQPAFDPPIVLKRADPIDVGRQRRERQRHPPHRRGRGDVDRRRGAAAGRIRALACCLDADRGGHQRDREDDCRAERDGIVTNHGCGTESELPNHRRYPACHGDPRSSFEIATGKNHHRRDEQDGDVQSARTRRSAPCTRAAPAARGRPVP